MPTTARTSSRTITDPYTNLTTFSYSGGYLQTIKDPAGRLTTFTNSGGKLTGASSRPMARSRHIPTIPRAG